MPCSLKVGISTPGSRSGEEMPSARSLPAWICCAISLRPPVADGDVAAHDLGQHLAAGAGHDVVHLGDVAAGRLDDQGAQDVVGTAQSEAAPADRAGVGLELGEQVANDLIGESAATTSG